MLKHDWQPTNSEEPGIMSKTEEPRTMNEEEVFEAVRGAVIWAKAEVVTLAPVRST